MRRLLIILAALLPLFANAPGFAPAMAQPAASNTSRGEVDPALVDQIVAYLNSVRTLEARFIQRNNDGGQITGKMWVRRPGRIRFEYDAPLGDVIWSNKGPIMHFDKDLEAVTHVPVQLTPAWFLLDDQVKIRKDVNILATAAVNGRVFLTASQDGALTEGRVTLAFEQEPMQIIGWNVVDGSGQITQVDLRETVIGAPIDKQVFRYEPPIEQTDTR